MNSGRLGNVSSSKNPSNYDDNQTVVIQLVFSSQTYSIMKNTSITRTYWETELNNQDF